MTLVLNVLGTPQLEVRGRVVKLGIKPMLVLAYLALEGRASRRDLARLLWSNASDPLNSVSAARVSIRDVLKKWLEGDAETLFLQAGFTCDALQLEAALLEVDNPDSWHQALMLYRGAFLENVRLPEWEDGFGGEFEDWLLTRREQLEATRAELAWRLARVYLAGLEVSDALALLEITQAEHLPPREDATRLLILAAGALNREIRAQTAFQKLETRLREELEVQPSSSTRAALELARSNPEVCLATLKKEFAIQPNNLGVSLGLEQGVDVPVFGRDQELAVLSKELERVRNGATRLVLLSGEPGVGKTRLTREMARVAQPAWVLAGVAAPTGLPLGLFDRIVRRAVQQKGIEHLNRVWQSALAAFLPDALQASSTDTNKEHLFAAISALLTDPSQCTVLLLDDLQWADQTSLELLIHLVQQPRTQGLLVLCTLRNTETPLHNLRSIFEIITREQRGTRVEIQGIPESAVAEIAQTLGRQTDPLKLHQQSGGNPFYVLELLRAGNTNDLTDLVKNRIEVLPDTAQQLLEVAALLGNGQQLTALRSVSGRSLEEISENLDHLAITDILHLTEEGTRFKHDLIREVVLNNIRSARKQILHLRAARALAPTQAARHALAAKDAWEETDILKMLHAFLETGKQHSIRGDLTSALEWFEHARSHSQNASQRLHALTERAAALERYGRHNDALETLNQAAILEPEVTDPVRRSAAWLARANLLALKMHRLEEAQVLVSQALIILEEVNHSAAQLTRSDALNIQGTIYRLEKKYPEAAQAFEASLTIRQALEDDAKIAISLMNLGMVYTQMSDSRTEQTLQESLKIYRKLGDDSGIARNLNNLGMYYTQFQKYEQALNAFQQALELNRLFFDPWAEARAYQNIGTTHFYLAEYHLAQQNYQSALEKAFSIRDSENQLLALLNLLEVAEILQIDSTVWLEQIKPFVTNESFSSYHTEINKYLSQQGVNS